MTEHPLELSAHLIDNGITGVPTDRQTRELSELADGVAIVESFSHAIAIETGEGLVSVDTSGFRAGQAVVEAVRGWSTEPIVAVIYTHGHLDHVGGSGAFAADADQRGHARPRVIAHERVTDRFERYRATSGYNQIINARQFGGAAGAAAQAIDRPFLPEGTLWPDPGYRDDFTETIGAFTFEHHHCKGETDDHTWTWIPERKMITAGDQFIWRFPNCGNPQKVQRYPLEWAQSLRAMQAKGVELFVPAHGLPIAGAERIDRCLDTAATVLENLVADVVGAMNTGASLDAIVNDVSVPAHVLELPYLQPLYDEPEFVIRNIWRLYGGWWDGNPARLKPPADAAVGAEITRLAGGVTALIDRALELSVAGDHRMACQLIEYAAAAEPESAAVHEARSTIYTARRASETSLMAKGIYGSAAADSQTILTGETPEVKMVVDLGTT